MCVCIHVYVCVVYHSYANKPLSLSCASLLSSSTQATDFAHALRIVELIQQLCWDAQRRPHLSTNDSLDFSEVPAWFFSMQSLYTDIRSTLEKMPVDIPWDYQIYAPLVTFVLAEHKAAFVAATESKNVVATETANKTSVVTKHLFSIDDAMQQLMLVGDFVNSKQHAIPEPSHRPRSRALLDAAAVVLDSVVQAQTFMLVSACPGHNVSSQLDAIPMPEPDSSHPMHTVLTWWKSLLGARRRIETIHYKLGSRLSEAMKQGLVQAEESLTMHVPSAYMV
jgi:hypothetical protein